MILVVTKPGNSKLAGVKFLKRLTQLSLLECKLLIDKGTFSICIKDDMKIFNEEIKGCDFGWIFLDDIQSQRKDKFIQMGMAEKAEIIDRLIQLNSALGGSHEEHLKKVYHYLSKEQLVQIFTERQKEIKEIFYGR